MFKLTLLLLPVLLSGAGCTSQFSETYMSMLTNEKRKIEFTVSIPSYLGNVTFNFKPHHKENLVITPNSTLISGTTAITKVTVEIEALKAGETTIFSESPVLRSEQAFVSVQVYRNDCIEILSIVIGWAYFFAWSISFYPQIYENYKRKSVVGLNFDFVVINITGYVLYAAFNLGLCYIPEIRMQYEDRYPFSIVSVLPNDIVFSLHAIGVTVYTGLQCLWYDTGDQKVSWFGKAFHYISAVILSITVILCLANVVLWLDFLYICSYIKLSVTFCKYGPQAVMNYQRKSTDGWSIGTVLLDIAGGICSVLQMFMNAYNYDKWEWILENPTKLWLGVFSLLFDFFFVFQHYCLYHKNTKCIPIKRHDKNDINMDDKCPEKKALNAA